VESRIDRDSGSQTLGPSPVVIRFFGLYGPRTRYLDFGVQNTPNLIWYWVFGSRARARTHEADTERNND
jgi:hypothetical protein